MIWNYHDRYFEDYPRPAREMITNARLVQDEPFEIEGLKMYDEGIGRHEPAQA